MTKNYLCGLVYGFSSGLLYRFLYACAVPLLFFMIFLGVAGCAHKSPVESGPELFRDNRILFEPARLWRIILSWESVASDANKAALTQEYQLVVTGPKEVKALKNLMSQYGGSENFLIWLRSQVSVLLPIDTFVEPYSPEHPQYFEYHDRVTISFIYKRIVDMKMQATMQVGPIWVPDPLVMATLQSCDGGQNAVDVPLLAGEEFGIEVEIRARREIASTIQWPFKEISGDDFIMRTWSTAAQRGIRYRAWLRLTQGVSSCPVPPRIRRALDQMFQKYKTSVGVQW